MNGDRRNATGHADLRTLRDGLAVACRVNGMAIDVVAVLGVLGHLFASEPSGPSAVWPTWCAEVRLLVASRS
jgi:hypothetical protein